MALDDDLTAIWSHYGQERQLRKLMEEAYELTDAVREGDVEHMEEEYADVLVVLSQIARAYSLDEGFIARVVDAKVARTLYRMKGE